MQDCSPLVQEYLTLLNCAQASVLPSLALECYLSWLADHNSDSPMLVATLQRAGDVVSRPAMLCSVAEAALEAFFGDNDDGSETFCNRGGDGGDAWALVEPMAKVFPTAAASATAASPDSKVTQALEESVRKGYVLYLYLYLRRKGPSCKDIHEENALISTILEWMRHLKYR